ncbi:hypothetical protein Q3G72_009661 [Acer saccharum]|nr:hypothetical protein Q3G72_009661 [Acer saccharum]
MKSIESFTDFGSLYEHEGGHILVGYSIGVLPKGYMVPSIEALRQRKFTVARVEFMVAIPRMLKKDTGQLDDRLDDKELLSLRSLVDSVMKSIESFTDFGSLIGWIEPKVRCKEKAMVLFVKMIISCALQFAKHEVGHFLVGYLLGVLPKGLQGTKHRSSEAGEFNSFGISLQSCDCRFEPQCKDCPCRQVAIPRMLKKDTGQLDDREA